MNLIVILTVVAAIFFHGCAGGKKPANATSTSEVAGRGESSENSEFAAEEEIRNHMAAFAKSHPELKGKRELLRAYVEAGHGDKLYSFMGKKLERKFDAEDADPEEKSQVDKFMGTIWLAKGNYDKSLIHFKKALATDLKHLDQDHPKVAQDWSNIGRVLGKKGGYDKALEYFEKALASNINSFGKDHQVVARNWFAIGLAWEKKKSFDKALGYYEKAYISDLKNLGKDHPDVAWDLSGLGRVWAEKGETKKGLDYLEQALEIAKKSGIGYVRRSIEKDIDKYD